ncbi:prolactin regulatory element-binding protein [Galendromus occidentalis]|uniref:Prolactin regulatory element-binding protein n=1 Tax=Galendromus occidentalis TaxID=34638 RepID=A0AAJ6QQW2_9ACAR|nr:prolactin regulatory element-binding protein [Galendromus occidentalis]
MAPAKDRLVGRVDIPLYSINAVSERHVVVAGGGGKAKTGVANKIEVLEVVPEEKGTFTAEVVASYDTSDAVMNATVCQIKDSRHLFIAAGIEDMCEMYRMKYTIQTPKFSNGAVKNHEAPLENVANLRKRKAAAGDAEPARAQPNDRDANLNSLRLGFDITPEISFKSDFSEKNPFQKVVRFAPLKGVILTGGGDGYLRAWKSPTFNKVFEVKAHEGPIDDIAVSTQDESIVTIAKDGKASVWDFNGKRVLDLHVDLPVQDKYVYRNCRFGIVEGNKSVCRMFTLLNPAAYRRPPRPTYIVKWNPHKGFMPEKIKEAGVDCFSTMAVSDDGVFIGVGRLSGAVEIYISFSLERIYVCEKSHSTFVTGLTFLRSSRETRNLTQSDATLISISVDNKLKAHCIPPQSSMSVLGIVCFFICFMILVYIVLNVLGL